MRKVQFFILIETIIFMMAFFDILANEGARAILLFSVILLLIRHLIGSKEIDFLLISAGSLFFLVFMLNPYFILGMLLISVYMIVNFFSRYEKKNQYTHIILDDQPLEAQKEKSQWFGNQIHGKDQYGFEDINIIRLFGNDIIDLDEGVLVGRDNIVVIRKTFGRTKIVVPIDVEVSLSASSLYGRVQFLNLSFWDLRNESFSLSSPGYKESHKRVKIVVNCLFGDVEVIRV
ncbi:membrane protein [Streptococcus varani]|uniref:Membrane protein n=1 Tax=Streptococcus varani TaxID=1608583 RepID=A0A0E3WFM2_9STRE|nr:cell wall-active antibiotics response protein LiaF [Streptococcus varani]CQR25768.1 membrane protein [Streptococcus varani]